MGQMGRPRLAAGTARSAMIFAMVRPEEKAQLVARALELDRSGSSIVRSALLAFLHQEVTAAEVAEPATAAGIDD